MRHKEVGPGGKELLRWQRRAVDSARWFWCHIQKGDVFNSLCLQRCLNKAHQMTLKSLRLSCLHQELQRRRWAFRSPPDGVTSRTMRRVNLINQQMGDLYNVFIPPFLLFSLQLLHLFCLSAPPLLSSPSVHFSLHFVTQITLSLRHLFRFPPPPSLPRQLCSISWPGVTVTQRWIAVDWDRSRRNRRRSIPHLKGTVYIYSLWTCYWCVIP